MAISTFLRSQELEDDGVEQLDYIVEHLNIGLDMQIMEIDGTSTYKLPDSIILLVSLDP